MKISARKLDHLVLTAYYPVEHETSTLLEEVTVVPRAAPEASLEDIDTSIRIAGKRLRAPIIVSGMTGGHPVAGEINAAIAEAVEELGLGMGVGSQRAMLRDPSTLETYRVARRRAPTALLIGNIGAAQLLELSIEDVEKLVEAIEADALAVHLNVPQEMFQPEGDTRFRGVLEAIERLVERLSIPIIVKETGHSIDPATVVALVSRGIEYIDVSGAGGTSWVRVEELRAKGMGRAELAEEARVYRNWGLPTAVALMAARWVAPSACILAGGGIRTSLDILRAIVVGADAVTLALPVLRAYSEGGARGVRSYLERLIDGLKRGMLMSGAKSIRELYRVEYLVGPRLASMLGSIGVDLGAYRAAARARLYTSRPCG